MPTVTTMRSLSTERSWTGSQQTAQRTNNVMRVLTVVALTLLPATLIAGILGVNMLPKYLLHPWALWVGIGLMVVIAAVVLLAMRLLRRWL